MNHTLRPARRLLAPEVVQTSTMDCGPAALKCLLEGFGIPVNYARLQQACHTHLDGTSINTIEQIGTAFGLEVEQIMVPVDHVLLHSAATLPAIAVAIRDGLTHFVVIWRQHGPLLQVMDPARGRRWIRRSSLDRELWTHAQKVPGQGWREWAGSDEFLNALRERLAALGVKTSVATRLLNAASADATWRGLATLDAAIRMTASLARAGGLPSSGNAGRVIEAVAAQALDAAEPHAVLPVNYWSVAFDPSVCGDGELIMRGAVLLRVRDRRVAETAQPTEADEPEAAPLSSLRESASERRRPLAEMWDLLRRDGALTPKVLGLAAFLAAAGVLAEMLLLRGFLDMGDALSTRGHRLVAIGLLVAFSAGLLLLDVFSAGLVFRLGRRLEIRLRALLLEKLPRLGVGYFQSRLISDVAHRAHSVDALRDLPDLGGRIARTTMQVVFTAIGLAWLAPHAWWLIAIAAILALAIPLSTQHMFGERELRQRIHAAALSRHYLDSLLGLTAARAHGAERALRRQHESLLIEWGRSSLQLLKGTVVVETLQLLVGTAFAAWLVLDFIGQGGRPGATLLLIYWALNLPTLGRELAATIRKYPAYTNIFARAAEPLRADDESPSFVEPTVPFTTPGAAISFAGVDVTIGGQRILQDVNLSIKPGEHVAVVGRSGAGKSTLAGLLLGWRAPSAGQLEVDGAPLTDQSLAALRSSTAWIDPSVQLWNRSLFDNLRYGNSDVMTNDIGAVLETADLASVLETLPQGLQSPLGEGGGLTSGGEGQRVRFGRALARPDARLAILDEPFRGLDRHQRSELLARARKVWSAATLLCVTHDVEETLSFERVLVIEHGRVVEDGQPESLARTPGTLYAELLSADRAVKSSLYNAGWRRWTLQNGSISEESSAWNDQQISRGR